MVAPPLKDPFDGISEAFDEGYALGKSDGWRRGFAWGIFIGVVIAALVRWLVF